MTLHLLAVILCVMLPLWLLAGFCDWICHRHSHIERTAGPREPALHLLLYLLVAIPIALSLYLAIGALLLCFMAACVAAHMAVSVWDTSFAQPRRHISPLEQHIHSYQDMLPLFALTLTAVVHWDALRDPLWRWSVRDHPLLPDIWAWTVLLALLAGMLAIVEELLRCLRAARQSMSGIGTARPP
jgi:hypothetical protein